METHLCRWVVAVSSLGRRSWIYSSLREHDDFKHFVFLYRQMQCRFQIAHMLLVVETLGLGAAFAKLGLRFRLPCAVHCP